jgi:hypothetical protein
MKRQDQKQGSGFAMTRRGFLGGTAAAGGLILASSAESQVVSNDYPADWPAGKPIVVQPILAYDTPQPQDRTSWRGYGGIHSDAAAATEAQRIDAELKTLRDNADFPIEARPVVLVKDAAAIDKAALESDADILMPFAAGGAAEWYWKLANCGKPNLMFLRHKSGPYYLYHEIAHWRVLRHHEDAMAEPNMDVWDIVVDNYDEVLWRLRAMYGLKNARGTKVLAIGSLAAYSVPAQENGPRVARDLWGYEIEVVPREDFAQRLEQARADTGFMTGVEAETDRLLSNPKITLQTDRKFVVNSFAAWGICRRLLEEKGAFNFGFDHCMGHDIIAMLDTPPCLVLALANDAGYTAYCHTDLSHTMPGVLLRWITGRPTFVCNTHFPHDGIYTVAHCAAPMKMDGHHYEPVTLMTHYESDYGAASKVDYTRGQTVTLVQPDLHCTRWHGFRGTVADTPSLPMCRSQMDIAVDGDIRRITERIEGFHAQVVYGDYLREVGYALKKLGGLEWVNYSQPA